MYATIRHYKAKATDDLIRSVTEGFVPLISKTPGFIAFYALDSGSGDLVSITVFETKAAAENTNEAAAEWVSKHAPSIGKPEKIIGEVIVHKTTQLKAQLT